MDAHNNIIRIKYDRRFNALTLENGTAIPLFRACRFCLLEEEYICQENLDALAEMFPSFNEFQFSIFCTLLSPALMNYVAEAKGSELMKIPTREEFTDKERLDSIQQLFFWGVLHCSEPTPDFSNNIYKLSDGICRKLRECETSPFEVKKEFSLGEIIFPTELREEVLFYDADVLQSLEDIKECLIETNFKKLEKHFHKEAGHLAFTVLLEGPSGTGKTAFVKELARCTCRPIIFVDIAKLRGKDYGHDETMARKIFEEYIYLSCTMPLRPILFVDECDTLLSRRGNPDGNVNSSIVNLQNTVLEIWLQELDKFDGILFLTTNNPEFMDEALSRRLMFQVHIGHPDEETQVRLWRHFFPNMDAAEAREMARKTNFTGGQILKVKEKTRIKEILHGPVSFDDLLSICATNGKIQKRTPVGFCR